MDNSFGARLATSDVLQNLTRHAQIRMGARRLSREAVRAAIDFGRIVYTRGATIYAIGNKEVCRYARQMIDLSPYEGIQVVCSADGGIITAYRNRNFKKLRAHHRHK
jgi:hypothetical protein